MTTLPIKIRERLRALEIDAETALKQIDLCKVEKADLEMQILKSIMDALEVDAANPEVLKKEGLRAQLNQEALSILSATSQSLFQ